MHKWKILSVLTAFCLLGAPVKAESVAEFYKGNTIRLVLPTAPGGSTSLFGLTMSEFLPRFIPGKPRVVAEYRVGAGGVVAANYVYNAAPKDGSVITMLIAGLLTEDTQPGAVQFDAARFSYIGRAADLPRALIAWHTSGLETIEDARETEVVLGASGRGATAYIHPALINEIFGTRFRIITGYRGAGTTYLALERGEIGATTVAWDGLLAGRGDWLRDGQVRVLVTIGSRKFAGYENVPKIVDLAKTEEDRALLEYATHTSDFGQVLAAPPGIPQDRLDALRKAFDEMVQDPEFLATAKDKKMVIDPMSGRELQSFVERMAKRPAEVAKRLRAVVSD